MNRRHFAAAIAVMVIASPLFSAEPLEEIKYGHLRGRFVYDGEPPKPTQLFDMGLAVAPNERLLVNPMTHGIANLGVWLEPRRGEPLPPIHPSYGMHVAKPEGPRTKTLTIAKNRFEPHFVLLRTDEVLAISNTEKRAIDVKLDFLNNAPLALFLPPGGEKAGKLAEVERIPAMISSGIVPWMHARILVKDHPYFATTDNDGNFEIRHLPAGAHEFRFWHEQAGYITNAKRDGVPQKWTTGKTKVTIPADATLDLGDVLISPDAFPE